MISASFGEIAERLRRSTVEVKTAGEAGGGSGVVWNAKGMIVTNAHVARSKQATIGLWDGRQYPATLTSRDAGRDLATFKIDARDLAPAVQGNSRALRPGEIVIAVGNPLGFTGALTTGVVHALGPVAGVSRRDWVQADVRLAPGNSGGPLADSQGRVVGINTMVVAGRLGLAVPTHDIERFLRAGRTATPHRCRRATGTLEPFHRSVAHRSHSGYTRCAGLAAHRRHSGRRRWPPIFERRRLERRHRRGGRPPDDPVRAWRQAVCAGTGDPARGSVIRVQIASGSPVIRAGLESMLEDQPDMEIVDGGGEVLLVDATEEPVHSHAEMSVVAMCLATFPRPTWQPQSMRHPRA